MFFETGEQLASDSDVFPDVYERTGGTTTKLSQGSPDANGAQAAFFVGSSEDGSRVWYASAEKLVSTDTDSGTDVFEIRQLATYPRPKGATPLKVALVPAFEPCTAPNRLHGPPTLGPGANDPSCNPPEPSSAHLTVGAPDSNGAPAKSSGFVRLATTVGDPGTPADEADLRITLDLVDVRRQGSLADYTGELLATMPMRLIDKYSGSTPVDAATMTDFTASFPASCTATADTTVGRVVRHIDHRGRARPGPGGRGCPRDLAARRDRGARRRRGRHRGHVAEHAVHAPGDLRPLSADRYRTTRFSGEGGIRTHVGSVNPPNRLAGGCLQPLGHLSKQAAGRRPRRIVGAGLGEAAPRLPEPPAHA